jgi:prepilin-type processing-associated H-X9-DG protein
VYLKNSKLGPYTKGPVDLYKCPADFYTCSIAGQQLPRVRSISLNAFLEGGVYHEAGSHWFPTYRRYNKMADITQPPPSQLFAFVDEHPDSINDGFMLTGAGNRSAWCDLPASYHNGACGFSFVDGHAEINKCREASTFVPVTKVMHNWDYATRGMYRDLDWMLAHATALR